MKSASKHVQTVQTLTPFRVRQTELLKQISHHFEIAKFDFRFSCFLLHVVI
jgi:hypothetical protein